MLLYYCRLDEKTHTVIFLFGHGSHNVSRWMTWLPISLKNAAKCDKWYQLQNHPITESLNAKGAREKTLKVHPRACRILSVEKKISFQKKRNTFFKRESFGRGETKIYFGMACSAKAMSTILKQNRIVGPTQKKEEGFSQILFFFCEFVV